MDIEIVNMPERHRYEARVDGVVAGYADYRPKRSASPITVVVHTEVSPEFEGRGVGSALARGVLDDIRARGGSVVPACPFIAGYIRGHAQYQDLVATGADPN